MYTIRLVSHHTSTSFVLILVTLSLLPAAGRAQSLRGSRASVERAYRFAVAHRLPFHRTRATIERASRRGEYVRIGGSRAYRLRRVGIPYVLPATRAFVGTLAERYQRSCRERLVVTSGMRPATRRLVNSTPKSVHPTGLAIDLRAPRGRCRGWLRTQLLSLERRGVIDATEERSPAHFHVVVFRAS